MQCFMSLVDIVGFECRGIATHLRHTSTLLNCHSRITTGDLDRPSLLLLTAGDFRDATVLREYGDAPDDLSAL